MYIRRTDCSSSANDVGTTHGFVSFTSLPFFFPSKTILKVSEKLLLGSLITLVLQVSMPLLVLLLEAATASLYDAKDDCLSSSVEMFELDFDIVVDGGYLMEGGGLNS